MLKYFSLLFMFVLLCCVGCVYFAYLALLRMVRVALCASFLLLCMCTPDDGP
jgi:hypothetical protein